MAQRIVIVLNGGLVDAVFLESEDDMEVVVVDWDDLETQGYEVQEYSPDEHKLVRAEGVLDPNDMPRELETVIAQWDRYQGKP